MIYTYVTFVFAIIVGIILAQADETIFIGMAILITTLWMLFLGAWMYSVHKKK